MRILIINFKLWNSDAWKCVRWFSKLIWKWNCPLPPPLNSYCEICINESWILNDGITASSQMALSGKEPVCQCQRYKRRRFNLWVGKIPWRRKIATHSSILAWEIPRKSSLAGDSLWGQSMGSQRVRHDWSNSARLWESLSRDPGTPVFARCALW